MPMLKACLTYCGASDREAKTLLHSDALKSMVCTSSCMHVYHDDLIL